MRLFRIIALVPVAACAQQMVSMQTTGDTTFITVRVRENTFVTFSGAPYSAKRVTVGMQVRADGTRIPQNQVALFYRDQAGRNRTEQQVAMRDSPYMVTIMDPILGCEYVLDPGNRIAHRLVGVRVGTRPVPASEPETPGPADLAAATPGSVTVHTEDLGSRTMQGLNVVGTRTTTTWPPGTRQGNDHTQTGVFESWVAASLGHVVVSSHTANPGMPESSFALEDVLVGPPKAELFMPPPDYRIVDEKSDFKIAVPRNPSAPQKLTNHGVTAATIPNAPFAGARRVSSVQTLADGTRVERQQETTFSAWRDSQGRVRTEWPPRGNVPGGVEIKDPASGFVYNLDYVNHIAYRTALTSASAPPAAAPAADAAGATVSVVQLGAQEIAGVPATGVRTTTTRSSGKPTVSEVWTARNEGVVLLEKNTTAAGDDVTIELKNFVTREPDPSLFRVPASYQVFDEYGNQIQSKH